MINFYAHLALRDFVADAVTSRRSSKIPQTMLDNSEDFEEGLEG